MKIKFVKKFEEDEEIRTALVLYPLMRDGIFYFNNLKEPRRTYLTPKSVLELHEWNDNQLEKYLKNAKEPQIKIVI